MVIWFIRILLPILLFCVYFKLQSPKESRKGGKGGPTYARQKLLAVREATLDCPAPEAVAGISLKESEASPSPARGRAGGKGKGRRDSGDKVGNRDKRGARDEEAEAQAAHEAQQAMEQEAIRVAELQEKKLKQEKMEVESFINHVAFKRSERLRVFLPDGPPPLPPLRRDAKLADAEVSREANVKAQSVLRGAMKLQHPAIVSVLHDRLLDEQVEVEETTYILMVELCILARELKLASDFLLKMENSGYVPDSELLDRVMDLYNQQKILKEQKAREQESRIEMADERDAVERQEAREEVVVPNCNESRMSPSAAPFNPTAAPFVPGDYAPPMASLEAAAWSPELEANDFANGKTVDSINTEGQRTKLKSSSKPFNPQFGSAKPFEPQFSPEQDQYMYSSWAMDTRQNLEGDAEYSQTMQGQEQYMYNWQVGDDPTMGNNESELFPPGC